jgi:hypothetical protein
MTEGEINDRLRRAISALLMDFVGEFRSKVLEGIAKELHPSVEELEQYKSLAEKASAYWHHHLRQVVR